jgi:DNA repair exonuclease SbcCD ATPase subunit
VVIRSKEELERLIQQGARVYTRRGGRYRLKLPDGRYEDIDPSLNPIAEYYYRLQQGIKVAGKEAASEEPEGEGGRRASRTAAATAANRIIAQVIELAGKRVTYFTEVNDEVGRVGQGVALTYAVAKHLGKGLDKILSDEESRKQLETFITEILAKYESKDAYIRFLKDSLMEMMSAALEAEALKQRLSEAEARIRQQLEAEMAKLRAELEAVKAENQHLRDVIDKLKALVEDYAKTLENVVSKAKQTIVFMVAEIPKKLPEEAVPVYTHQVKAFIARVWGE